MRRHVELLYEIAESRLGAVAEGLGAVVVGEEHEDIWFCSLLRLLFFRSEPGARVCGAEEEEEHHSPMIMLWGQHCHRRHNSTALLVL